MPVVKIACSHCRGARRLRVADSILPCPFCYVPRCKVCFDSKLVEKVGRMTACTDCREHDEGDDAEVDHEIDRAEVRASSVAGGAREDWSHTW